MEEKRTLYLETGAEELWVVTQEDRVRFGEEELEESALAEGFPEELGRP